MGVAATRRGDRVIREGVARQWDAFDRTREREEAHLWELATKCEQDCRAALADLWRYQEGPARHLLDSNRLTKREEFKWLQLRSERARLNTLGANGHQWRNIHRRILAWANCTMKRLASLCARRVDGDPRLVEFGGIAVWPWPKL